MLGSVAESFGLGRHWGCVGRRRCCGISDVLRRRLCPCPAVQSRVGTVVYGARNTLLGADGSWIAMLPGGGGGGGGAAGSGVEQEQQQQTAGEVVVAAARPHPFHPGMHVRRGVLADECGGLMQSFFARRRKEAAAAAAAAAGG